MAKITDFEDIKLSSLSDEDVFHIIDLSGDSIIGSRKLKYETLKESLNQSIGLNSLLSTWTDSDYVYFKYLLKNGEEKTISICLSSLVNIYEGDETYLHIDDETRQIQLRLSSVATNLTLSGYNVCVIDENQISAKDTTYSVVSSGLSIDSDNKIYLKIGSNLTFDQDGNLSANEGCVYSAGSGLKLEDNEFSIIDDYIKRDEVDETLALSSISSICGENITVSNGKLSAGVGNTYYSGRAIDVDDENKINVILTDLINETSSNISVVNNTLYVEPSTAKVTYITWE